MVKTLLILLGEWREFGHVMYEKLSYVLSILPGLAKEFCYGIRLLVRFLLRCLYGLRVEVRKGGMKVKIRIELWKHIFLYFDNKDKEMYRRNCIKEAEKRKKKLENLEKRINRFNEWLDWKISKDGLRLRDVWRKREERINRGFWIKVKTSGKGGKDLEKLLSKLEHFCIRSLSWQERMLVKVSKVFIDLENRRRDYIFFLNLQKKLVRWGDKFKDYLRQQDVPVEVKVFFLEKHLIPAIDEKIIKMKKVVAFLEKNLIIRTPKQISKWAGELAKKKEEVTFLTKRITIPGPLDFEWKVNPPVRVNFFYKKIPIFHTQKKIFYGYYLKKKEEFDQWWRNKKKERDDVVEIKFESSELKFDYGVKFYLKENKKVTEWEEYWDNSIYCRLFHFLTKYLKKFYCFLVFIVSSDPFVYAWNVFFLVTGVYFLLIIGPIIILFEWIRSK
jgi:hypothetical protein